MNILLDINECNIENIFLMESKENIVINGQFVKILYSPENFTMNGIYIDFPIIDYEKKNFNGKNIVYFDIKKNYDLISRFSNLETEIIHFYIRNGNINNKKIMNSIGTQLKNGMIKYYNYTFSANRFYLKISGIWETSSDIGITYKIIYY